MSRIGIAGFLHESNTFASAPTTYEQFASTCFTRGEELLERWKDSHHELGGFLAGCSSLGFEPVPLLATYAVPSGTIEAEAFDRIVTEMTDRLRAALPLDGLLVSLHGATVSAAYPDADAEVLRRIRAVVGPQFPIINTLDLHANVSREMIGGADATVIYRSNPHLDQRERGMEAAELLERMLRGEVHPVQALEMPPLLIQISRQYTAEQPARGLYEDAQEVLSWPGILSASVAMGFYYADVREMGASFLAVADGDAGLAAKAARWMARRAWDRREEFVSRIPGPEEAVRMAAAGEGPVVLMDVGDNVGGGSAADSTILFAEVLRQGISNALVILYDPEAVAACVAAGVRSTIELEVGGKTDRLHGNPVRVRGSVRTISDGLFVETQVRHGGWGSGDQGVTAVLETCGSQHSVVLTSKRMAPMSLEQVLSLGIHPERKRLLIAKGVVAPRAAYEPIARKVIVVDTPGVTSDNPHHFEYRCRRRPLYPLEQDAEY